VNRDADELLALLEQAHRNLAARTPRSTPMNDELAARRRAVAERLAAKQRAESIERIRQAGAVDHVGEAIADSIRKHPSNPKPFDWEAEG
jgi:hypothetical protein